MTTTKLSKPTAAVSPEPVALSSMVRVRRRFLRSVNLERDFYTDAPLEGYLPTPAALTSLERIAAGIGQASSRAFSLTGSYGTGKSAFALMLTKVLASPPLGDAALRYKVLSAHPSLGGSLFTDDKDGFWPVLITGAREPISAALVRALLRSLEHTRLRQGEKKAAQLIRYVLAQVPEANSLDPSAQAVARLYEVASAAVREQIADCQGLLVIVDEMGKFLEWAAHHPEQGDVQVLQEIAEAAVRSTKNPLLFVTILHQSFDEYAHRLGPTQRAEWQKVQGRFGDIPFGDASEETIRLISRAIEHEPGTAEDLRFAAIAKKQARICADLKLLPRSLGWEEFRDLLIQAYPLHPLTLLILPAVFRRFGQSERSLFSFLASEEPYGFFEFLRTHTYAPGEVPPILRVDDLYDYVVATLGSTLYGQPGAGKLWSQTQEALYRCQDRSPLDTRLVKTIGLLHIMGEQTRLLPSREVLHFAFADDKSFSESEIDAAINSLEAGTLITYRQFKRAYRPYEGSDIDVEARLREAKAEFAGNVDVAATAAKLSATLPMIARRHSFTTGTLRFFGVSIVRAETLQQPETLFISPESDGLLLLCLVADVSELRSAEASASSLKDLTNVIVGIAVESEALYEAALTLEALIWVKENTPELSNDNIAFREVQERILDAEGAFQTEWDTLLRPQADSVNPLWYHRGERVVLRASRELQQLISRACEETYPYTPHLRNELINRRQISSTAAAARRNLIEGMIERRDQPLLGIEPDSFPPERAMYATMLENTGMHQCDEAGEWYLQSPLPESDTSLARVWQEIETFLFAGELVAKPVTELIELLNSKPYGLSNGVIPVLLCAALLIWQDEVIVYDNSVFVTHLDTATFERLIKRPENFLLQGVRVSGERLAVVKRLSHSLLKEKEEPTVVNVVRALYRNMAHLPMYSMSTRTISAEAKALRDLLKEARAPEQLLFVNLPNLVGARPFTADKNSEENVNFFFSKINPCLVSLNNAYEALLERIQSELFSAFGVGSADELMARSNAVRPYATEPRLAAFLQATGNDIATPRKWLEAIGAIVVGKPPYSWIDADEKRFVSGLSPLGTAFQHAELVAFAKSRAAVDNEDASEESVGFRVSITQASGAEDARIVFMPKRDEELIENLTDKALDMFYTLMQNAPEEVRLAVISRVAQAIMRGDVK